MDEKERLIGALVTAREVIKWWEKEHGCCRGATDKQMAEINSVLADYGILSSNDLNETTDS